jgi:hypothetical protein
MQFDPKTREVTMVFQDVGKDALNNPVWRRAGFNLVTYDGDPNRWIEPVNACQDEDVMTTPVAGTKRWPERISGIEHIRGSMFEVHNFAPDKIDLS